MIESEVAETLMSLSAPDERNLDDNPLYAAELPSSWQASKKRAFAALNAGVFSSLPSSSSMQSHAESYSSPMSLLQLKIQGRPLTSMIPGREDADSSSSDVDMDSRETSDKAIENYTCPAYLSPFDGLVAAAASNRDDNDTYSSSNSRPISIPKRGGNANNNLIGYREPASSSSSSSLDRTHSSSYGKKHKACSLSRVQEDESFLGRDCSPTGVEEEDTWYDSDYKQRMRLASVCSSEGSEYGGLGRQHLEEFIRMEISAANENEQQREVSSDGKYIGSYSPEARRKRIERFLEKRKRRVWAKKVDYDVRKNFANSRLRVKGRFVKKEDEELLCQLLSYT
ncbi:unnamed protein product [Peronospora belbahrii]|uniref:CCT domain-containing protein n=1 Tax=Peronospora belbahrii TaxID=622444 RepID=A0ABN8D6Q9_9STRA|nr:unnamed protein product [Peronospora belbahrii]